MAENAGGRDSNHYGPAKKSRNAPAEETKCPGLVLGRKKADPAQGLTELQPDFESDSMKHSKKDYLRQTYFEERQSKSKGKQADRCLGLRQRCTQ